MLPQMFDKAFFFYIVWINAVGEHSGRKAGDVLLSLLHAQIPPLQDGGLMMQDLSVLRDNLWPGLSSCQLGRTHLVDSHLAAWTHFVNSVFGDGSTEHHFCGASRQPAWEGHSCAEAQLQQQQHSGELEHSSALPGTVSQLSCRNHPMDEWMRGETLKDLKTESCEYATVESVTWRCWSDRSKLVDA